MLYAKNFILGNVCACGRSNATINGLPQDGGGEGDEQPHGNLTFLEFLNVFGLHQDSNQRTQALTILYCTTQRTVVDVKIPTQVINSNSPLPPHPGVNH